MLQQCCTFFIVYLHTINEKGRNMKLSELKTGEKGIIVKVLGHGGFRKRIVEMGFIKGKSIEVLLNAPLQDPVKYKIMGYEVSLRHSEAELIEVVTLAEAKKIEGKLEATSFQPKITEAMRGASWANNHSPTAS